MNRRLYIQLEIPGKVTGQNCCRRLNLILENTYMLYWSISNNINRMVNNVDWMIK